MGAALTTRTRRSAVGILTGCPRAADDAVATATCARRATSVRVSPRTRIAWRNAGPKTMREARVRGTRPDPCRIAPSGVLRAVALRSEARFHGSPVPPLALDRRRHGLCGVGIPGEHVDRLPAPSARVGQPKPRLRLEVSLRVAARRPSLPSAMR
jgi:hypothetical protein